MNGSETIEDLKSLIFQSFDELGFGNRCGLLFAEIGNDLKAEERKCRKITKSLNESASMLEGVMKDIRAGEMEESEDDTRSIPSVSISDGFDIGDDEIMVVDDDPVAQLRYARGRPPLRMSFGQQQQNVSSGQHASLRNESGQYTRVVGVPVNASNQQMYYVGAGDANQHLSSTAPCFFRVMTVLNQPSPRPPELAVGMKLYARRHDNWSKGALVEIQNRERPFSERKFKIKFDGRGMKVVGSKGIAYTDHPKDNLLVGSRVIALYKDDERSFHSFYVGIIAEPPSLRNNNRYLVFFDDGYAQYSVATHLHQVCDQSKQVWEDIHPDSQEFIRSYLQQYPERPMVRLYPGQTIKTEWNGNWWVAHVQEVDASLVKMYFDFDKRVEWIYRGSTRLEPLYTELANAEASKQMGKGRRRNNLNNPKGSRKPFVEYTRCLEDPDPKKQMSYPMAADPPGDVQKPAKAAVAKKSTSKPQGMTVLDTPKQPPVVGSYDEQQNSFGYNNRTDRRLPNNRGNDSTESGAEGPLGAFVEIDRDQFVRKESLHKVRMPRSCSMLCLREVNDDPAAYKLKNPLLIPLYYFWERQVTKQRNNLKRGICYRAPCGRVLRSLIELDHYLMETNSKLTIDQFCFDPILRIDVEYIPVKTFCDIKDLSYGKENVPISCVNGIDRQYPDYVEYSNQRIPAKGVQLCLEEGFLVGCDCTDGCRDRSKCRCIQMTVEATSWSSGGRDEEAGYKFRRLQEPLLTGVFECNSRCRCDSRCHNRVVQHGLTLRLQVFKTDSRGWGLRCLDDIPAGGFICIYAGQLLTDEGANEDGKQYGDEYLAELDYMETVEKTKEGYESDICISEDSSSRSSRCSFGEAELNRDTDSTYSGERRLKKTGTGKRRRRRRKPAAEKMEKMEKMETKDEPTEKLQPLSDRDKSAAEQQITKTQDWLDKMPITISDDELENKDAEVEMDVDKPVSSETKAEDVKCEAETKVKEQDTTIVENNENKGSVVIEKVEEKETKMVENTENKASVVIEKVEEKEAKMVENAENKGSVVIEKVEEKEAKMVENTENKGSVVIEKAEEKESEITEIVEKKESMDIEMAEEKESTIIENVEEKESMVVEIANEKDKIVIENSEKKDIDQELKEESKNDEENVAQESKAELDKEFKESTEDSIGGTVVESDKANQVEKMDEEPSLLMITEPTSLNVDNVDLDNSDDECEEANSNGEQIPKSHEAVESVSANDLKRTTRSQTSRFHNLPDPKSQKRAALPQTKEKANERKNSGKLNDKGFVRTRYLFGEEYSYIMDAKSMGNLGRYLNHSCSPNAFVQSVFVDTHDLRFPWVAFFAFEYIRAGTELTWDYNYGIGSVPGKVLYCYCGSAECRGRLL